MKRKHSDRADWLRLIKKKFTLKYIKNEEFDGYVSTIEVEKVREPLIKNMLGVEVCVVDDGYTWLQHVPVDKHYALTTMYNDRKEIVQWYFDITKQNGVDDKGIPYFDDLYLDVVVLPSSKILLLDEDELRAALDNGDITLEDYNLAYREAKFIMQGMAASAKKLSEFSNRYLELMLKKSHKKSGGEADANLN